MSTPELRRRMAAKILDFEARRDANHHLKVYKLPPRDGGGRYEVAGINEKYDKDVVDALVELINDGRFDEAEVMARDYIADHTDRVVSWTGSPAIEFYLRDSFFNRGPGAARMLQAALGVKEDGAVGPSTRAAERAAEKDVLGLLNRLRAARENYELTVIGKRDEFWAGLVNRWNNALAFAKSLPFTAPQTIATPTLSMPAGLTIAGVSSQGPSGSGPSTLPALRMGATGARVAAWQAFLRGQGFNTGTTDGEFGEATRDATQAFQEKKKLTADGVAGRETLLKAAASGFELIEQPTADKQSSNFPPKPSFPPLVSNAQREAVFGHYDFVSAPTRDNPEAIRILGTWRQDNIIAVPIPQLRKALGTRAPATMQFHRLAAKQLQGMWTSWEKAGLLDRILVYDGSFVPRFVRGSRTTLSNHAFGSAFDINERFNKLGHRPALVGEKGSVRELVPIANDWGFWWGGHYDNRKDGMHFEVAFLK